MVSFKKFFQILWSYWLSFLYQEEFSPPIAFFPLLTLLLLSTFSDSIFNLICFNPSLFLVFLMLSLSQIEPGEASSNQDTTSLVFKNLLASWCKIFQSHLLLCPKPGMNHFSERVLVSFSVKWDFS